MSEFEIKDSSITKAMLVDKDYLSDDTKASVNNSDIVLLPFERFRESEVRCFACESIDFYKYVKQKQEGLSITFLENKNEVKTITLHSLDIWMPLILIVMEQQNQLAIVLNLISSFIYDKYKGLLKKEPANVHLDIIVEDKNSRKSKKISFVGPVEVFQEKFKQIDINKIMGE